VLRSTTPADDQNRHHAGDHDPDHQKQRHRAPASVVRRVAPPAHGPSALEDSGIARRVA
jgi:hypothetical protein